MDQATYNAYMLRIDELMKKGEANLTKAELDEIEIKSQQCEAYEDLHEPLKP